LVIDSGKGVTPDSTGNIAAGLHSLEFAHSMAGTVSNRHHYFFQRQQVAAALMTEGRALS
jgi:hypothetical protein